MAVVTRYSKGYPDPTALSAYSSNPHEARAMVRASYFEIPVANGDSINSLYKLAKIPSYAMLYPHSSLYATAIAGLASLSLGVIDDDTGTALPGSLMNAVNVSAGGSFSIVSALAAANYGKRLWQVLNLASDPKKDLSIYATVLAAPTANGTINGHIFWSQFGY